MPTFYTFVPIPPEFISTPMNLDPGFIERAMVSMRQTAKERGARLIGEPQALEVVHLKENPGGNPSFVPCEEDDPAGFATLRAAFEAEKAAREWSHRFTLEPSAISGSTLVDLIKEHDTLARAIAASEGLRVIGHMTKRKWYDEFDGTSVLVVYYQVEEQ